MYYRKSSVVSGHFRKNAWIEEHFRVGTIVNSEAIVCVDPRKSISCKTSCWWCNAPVFFYRNNETGGCALFDSLGKPWLIHPCWKINKDADKVKIINKNLAESLFVESSDNVKFGKNLKVTVDILKTLYTGTLNKTTKLLIADEIFEDVIDYLFNFSIDNIVLINMDVIKQDDIYDFLKLMCYRIRNNNIEFCGDNKITMNNKKTYSKNSLSYKLYSGSIQNDYINISIQHKNLNSDYYELRLPTVITKSELLYFCQSIINYPYLIEYILTNRSVLPINEKFKLKYSIIECILKGTDNEYTEILRKDNIFEEYSKNIRELFKNKKFNKLDIILHKNGLVLLIDTIIKIKNSKKLIDFKDDVAKQLASVRMLRKSNFIKMVYSEITFEEFCFYHDILSEEIPLS